MQFHPHPRPRPPYERERYCNVRLDRQTDRQLGLTAEGQLIHHTINNFNIAPDKLAIARVQDSLSTLSQARELRIRDAESSLKSTSRFHPTFAPITMACTVSRTHELGGTDIRNNPKKGWRGGWTCTMHCMNKGRGGRRTSANKTVNNQNSRGR